MRNTSGIKRKDRKAIRKARKAKWKKELPSYYYPVKNVSKAGITYINIKHR